MSEAEEKQGEERAGEEHRLSLGDRGDVYQICFVFFENVSELFVQASTGELSSAQAEEKMSMMSRWLTEVLLGHIPGVEAKEGWTGAPLARSLVAVLSPEIARMPREAQEALSSTEGVLMFAAVGFMHDVQETVSAINRMPEDETGKAVEEQGRMVHELCLKWADRFTGGGRPDIITPDRF